MQRISLIDNEDVGDSAKKMLELNGLHISTASSAEEGISAVESGKFDIIVTDVNMPGVSGVNAIKTVRKFQPKVRIPATSGSGKFGPTELMSEAITTTAVAQATAETGANGISTKPFEKSEGLDDLRRLRED